MAAIKTTAAAIMAVNSVVMCMVVGANRSIIAVGARVAGIMVTTSFHDYIRSNKDKRACPEQRVTHGMEVASCGTAYNQCDNACGK
jgi:hypothetical protein